LASRVGIEGADLAFVGAAQQNPVASRDHVIVAEQDGVVDLGLWQQDGRDRGA